MLFYITLHKDHPSTTLAWFLPLGLGGGGGNLQTGFHCVEQHFKLRFLNRLSPYLLTASLLYKTDVLLPFLASFGIFFIYFFLKKFY